MDLLRKYGAKESDDNTGHDRDPESVYDEYGDGAECGGRRLDTGNIGREGYYSHRMKSASLRAVHHEQCEGRRRTRIR